MVFPDRKLSVLYIGPTWLGSSARAMREGLDRLPDLKVNGIAEDSFFPPKRRNPMKTIDRHLRTVWVARLERYTLSMVRSQRPDCLVVYKGNGVRASLVHRARAEGTVVVNVFPDYSPHDFGEALAEAMGEYDLVISTKPFHPENWATIYGYSNPCAFVPHGYDPSLHLWADQPDTQEYDVVLAASWRREYDRWMRELAQAWKGPELRVAIAGGGWQSRWKGLPSSWEYVGEPRGRAYGAFLRRGKIAIAPIQREVVVGNWRQPGDVDTIRTYELAAAHCFFLHQRTDYLRTVYDEQTEVPLWSTAEELCELIEHFLPREEERRAMAAAAHARAVPAYSISSRAVQVAELLRSTADSRLAQGGT